MVDQKEYMLLLFNVTARLPTLEEGVWEGLNFA